MSAHEFEASPRVAIWRGWLIAVGVVLLAIGGLTMLTRVDPATYPGVIAWLAGAIILHDGIGAMAVFAATVLLRRVGVRVPSAVLAIVQGAAVVGLVVIIVVVPEIVKQMVGTANPSILPLDYAGNLLLFLAGLAVVTAVAVVVALVVNRRGRRDGRRATESAVAS